jgi:hypothetical protein
MNYTNISGEHASPKRHGSLKSQQNPNTPLNLSELVYSVDVTNKLRNLARSVYDSILSVSI